MLHWYALHTLSHKEKLVAGQLRERKLNVFLPLALLHRPGRHAVTEQPYFPGYLFVRADLVETGTAPFLWTPGLRSILKVGGEPVSVSDALIAELSRHLQEMREAGGLIFHAIQSGDRVKITSGPFAGYEAIFDARLAGSERVRVLVELIQHRARREEGRALRLELNGSDLEPLQRSRGRRRH